MLKIDNGLYNLFPVYKSLSCQSLLLLFPLLRFFYMYQLLIIQEETIILKNNIKISKEKIYTLKLLY